MAEYFLIVTRAPSALKSMGWEEDGFYAQRGLACNIWETPS